MESSLSPLGELWQLTYSYVFRNSPQGLSLPYFMHCSCSFFPTALSLSLIYLHLMFSTTFLHVISVVRVFPFRFFFCHFCSLLANFIFRHFRFWFLLLHIYVYLLNSVRKFSSFLNIYLSLSLPAPRRNPTLYPCFTLTLHHPSSPLSNFLFFLLLFFKHTLILTQFFFIFVISSLIVFYYLFLFFALACYRFRCCLSCLVFPLCRSLFLLSFSSFEGFASVKVSVTVVAQRFVSGSASCTDVNACHLYSRPHFRAQMAYKTLLSPWPNFAECFPSLSALTLSGFYCVLAAIRKGMYVGIDLENALFCSDECTSVVCTAHLSRILQPVCNIYFLHNRNRRTNSEKLKKFGNGGS